MIGGNSQDRVVRIEVFVVDLSQDEPYLGTLRDGEEVNQAGYLVRNGNRTVYPAKNRSLVVRLETRDGAVGWGETYGLVAPKATAEIINELLASFVIEEDPFQAETLHDKLYDLMRVRGYWGGFYHDAIAALDIALWDVSGRIKGASIAELAGGQQSNEIAAYISGLPRDTLPERCELAGRRQEQGFTSFKFALPMAADAVAEQEGLRAALGEDARIAADLHWSLTAEEAVALAQRMAPFNPWFLEAPVAPEDVEALRTVAEQSGQQIAAGEEWSTLHTARQRLDRKACHIVQPEMGHTGVTEFLRIGRHAEACGVSIIPHATIGSGIFLAASLQAASALPSATDHEYQHSLFGFFRHFTGDRLSCEKGAFAVLDAPGHGVDPSEAMLKAMTLIPA